MVETLTRLAELSSTWGMSFSPKIKLSKSIIKKYINIRDQRVIQKARLENNRR